MYNYNFFHLLRFKAVVLLLLNHCLMLLPLFGPCFVIQYFMSFYFCNYLAGEEIAGCFKLCSRCLVTVSVLWFFLTMQWIGLQSVIMIFPDHIYFHFRYNEFGIVKCTHQGTQVILSKLRCFSVY